jgi:hypothetical protein
MDDLIASTGVGYRALTNPSFTDNIARQVATIKSARQRGRKPRRRSVRSSRTGSPGRSSDDDRTN